VPLNPLYFVPILASYRHHQSNDNCLQGIRGKLSGLLCAALCATVVHSAALRGGGGAMGARAPRPAVLVARNWWEWKIFVCCYRSVRGPAFGTAPGPALALMQPWLCTVQWTHMNRPNSCLLVRYSFSVVILCVTVYLC